MLPSNADQRISQLRYAGGLVDIYACLGDRTRLQILSLRLEGPLCVSTAFRSSQGSGIGLTNVRRVLQRHGGRVWIEGRLGEGSTIFFTLPEREPDLQAV